MVGSREVARVGASRLRSGARPVDRAAARRWTRRSRPRW
jgi:hypothetical protein